MGGGQSIYIYFSSFPPFHGPPFSLPPSFFSLLLLLGFFSCCVTSIIYARALPHAAPRQPPGRQAGAEPAKGGDLGSRTSDGGGISQPLATPLPRPHRLAPGLEWKVDVAVTQPLR